MFYSFSQLLWYNSQMMNTVQTSKLLGTGFTADLNISFFFGVFCFIASILMSTIVYNFHNYLLNISCLLKLIRLLYSPNDVRYFTVCVITCMIFHSVRHTTSHEYHFSIFLFLFIDAFLCYIVLCPFSVYCGVRVTLHK